jgi:hypothetical protein
MKHLVAIAEAQFKADLKRYDWMKEEDRDRWVESNLQELKAVRKALLNGRYYTGVESVSSSGMSRVIKIKYIDNNKLHGVSDEIYKLAGCDKNHRIGGCGMDMLFHAQYNLFQVLCPNMRYQDKMTRYNSL